MKGFGQSHASLTRQLAETQERRALARRSSTIALTLFRLYTERKDNLARIASKHFDGATVMHTEGVYNGQTELGAIVEVLTPYARVKDIIGLASDIVDTNAQETVLVTVLGGPNAFESFNVVARQ